MDLMPMPDEADQFSAIDVLREYRALLGHEPDQRKWTPRGLARKRVAKEHLQCFRALLDAFHLNVDPPLFHRGHFLDGLDLNDFRLLVEKELVSRLATPPTLHERTFSAMFEMLLDHWVKVMVHPFQKGVVLEASGYCVYAIQVIEGFRRSIDCDHFDKAVARHREVVEAVLTHLIDPSDCARVSGSFLIKSYGYPRRERSLGWAEHSED